MTALSMARPPMVDGCRSILPAACTLSGVTPLAMSPERRVDIDRAADLAFQRRLVADGRGIESAQLAVGLEVQRVVRQRGVEHQPGNPPAVDRRVGQRPARRHVDRFRRDARDIAQCRVDVDRAADVPFQRRFVAERRGIESAQLAVRLEMQRVVRQRGVERQLGNLSAENRSNRSACRWRSGSIVSGVLPCPWTAICPLSVLA